MLTAAEKYLIFGMPRIAGWLNPFSAELIMLLSYIQTAAGFRGAVGEIGVHHGKLFTVLLLGRSADEAAFAIDVFERQDLNVDGSGRGDRSIFEANVRKWTGAKDVVVIAKSSLDVEPNEILETCGPVRLASIDGGHTAECAHNDLMLMDRVLAEHGIAILDDYFNHDWPDVSTGTAHFLADSGSSLRPFLISPNKVYLCRPDYSRLYRDRIAAFGLFGHAKPSRMFDNDVDIYAPAPPTAPGRILLTQILKPSRVGTYLLAAKTALSGTGRLPDPRTLKAQDR